MYVELHCHSAYSFLDGASQPEELAARAAELGYEALALTDHDGVYGSLELAHAAKALGVRPITGAEVTLEGGAHLTLLVETPQGYANLCRLLTAAHAGTSATWHLGHTLGRDSRPLRKERPFRCWSSEVHREPLTRRVVRGIIPRESGPRVPSAKCPSAPARRSAATSC